MKNKWLVLLLVVQLVFLVGCNKTPAEVHDIPDNELVSENLKNNEIEAHVMPRPFGVLSDGDMNRSFYEPCEILLDGIPVELLRLVEQSDYDNWKSKHNIFEKAPSSLTEYRNIYSFIVEFDISDEEVLTALEVYLNSDDPRVAISEEDINVILSKDESAIVERFASKYSITLGEKIYSPQWVYENSIAEYKNAGITPEMIECKLELYRNVGLSNEAALAFENKLTEFIGEKVNFLLLTLNTGFEINANNTSKNDIKAFTLKWLITHTIQDYISNGITIDMLEEYLNKNKELLDSSAFNYINSCLTRMKDDLIDEQVEISCDEIRALVDLDYTFTNYSHYAPDMISHTQDEYVLKDTHMYFKITDPDLDTWAEWEEFCKSIYCSDLLNTRLNEIKDNVIDIDGYAYVRPGGQGRPMSTDCECRIIEQKDGHAVAQAIYTNLHEEDLGEEIIYTYKFELTASGWRIASADY